MTKRHCSLFPTWLFSSVVNMKLFKPIHLFQLQGQYDLFVCPTSPLTVNIGFQDYREHIFLYLIGDCVASSHGRKFFGWPKAHTAYTHINPTCCVMSVTLLYLKVLKGNMVEMCNNKWPDFSWYLMCTLREKGWAKCILTLPFGFLQSRDHSRCNTELNPTCEDMCNTLCSSI